MEYITGSTSFKKVYCQPHFDLLFYLIILPDPEQEELIYLLLCNACISNQHMHFLHNSYFTPGFQA